MDKNTGEIYVFDLYRYDPGGIFGRSISVVADTEDNAREKAREVTTNIGTAGDPLIIKVAPWWHSLPLLYKCSEKECQTK